MADPTQKPRLYVFDVPKAVMPSVYEPIKGRHDQPDTYTVGVALDDLPDDLRQMIAVVGWRTTMVASREVTFFPCRKGPPPVVPMVLPPSEDPDDYLVTRLTDVVFSASASQIPMDDLLAATPLRLSVAFIPEPEDWRVQAKAPKTTRWGFFRLRAVGADPELLAAQFREACMTWFPEAG